MMPYEQAIETAAARWRRQAGAAGLELECATLNGHPTHGHGPSDATRPSAGAQNGAAGNGDARAIDPHLLRSVLDPLVENAVQHTADGGTVAVLSHDEGSVLVVDVRDTGHGVAPQVRDRLFRPWTTTRGDRGGAGLGLWLSRESARAAGGDVVLVDDRPGTTTFRVRLPLG
jgi:signal transduction histidine kinase